MKKLLLLPIFALSLAACDHDKTVVQPEPTATETTVVVDDADKEPAPYDNGEQK